MCVRRDELLDGDSIVQMAQNEQLEGAVRQKEGRGAGGGQKESDDVDVREVESRGRERREPRKVGGRGATTAAAVVGRRPT